MVLTARRKTCCVGPSPFTSILEEEPDITEDRRDSADSDGSLREDLRISRAHWGRGVQLVNPLDGEFTLVSSNNYDAFLAKVGAGPFSINLVQRARINLTIKQVRPEAGGLYYHVVHAGAGQALEHPLRDSDQGQVQQGIQDQSLEGDSEQVPAGGGEAGVSGRLGPKAAHVHPLLEHEGQQAHTTPGCRERSGKTVCHILT